MATKTGGVSLRGLTSTKDRSAQPRGREMYIAINAARSNVMLVEIKNQRGSATSARSPTWPGSCAPQMGTCSSRWDVRKL